MIQQTLIQAGFGALRTTYEALILFDVFNNVVRRFEERISVERLKDVVVDPLVANEIIEKVSLLSRYIRPSSQRRVRCTKAISSNAAQRD